MEIDEGMAIKKDLATLSLKKFENNSLLLTIQLDKVCAVKTQRESVYANPSLDRLVVCIINSTPRRISWNHRTENVEPRSRLPMEPSQPQSILAALERSVKNLEFLAYKSKRIAEDYYWHYYYWHWRAARADKQVAALKIGRTWPMPHYHTAIEEGVKELGEPRPHHTKACQNRKPQRRLGTGLPGPSRARLGAGASCEATGLSAAGRGDANGAFALLRRVARPPAGAVGAGTETTAASWNPSPWSGDE